MYYWKTIRTKLITVRDLIRTMAGAYYALRNFEELMDAEAEAQHRGDGR